MAGQPPRCHLKVARLALRPDLLGVGLDRVYGCVAAIAALGRRRKTQSIGSVADRDLPAMNTGR
jgi:hypothetical protein